MVADRNPYEGLVVLIVFLAIIVLLAHGISAGSPAGSFDPR